MRGVQRGAWAYCCVRHKGREHLSRELSEMSNNQHFQKQHAPAQPGSTYDWAHTYRTGQTLVHPTYGQGEVTSLIEPQKIDVLFADRVRRLIHSRVSALNGK